MNNDQQLELGAKLEENKLAFENIIWLPGNWAQTCDTLVELLEDGDYEEVLLQVFSLRGLKDYQESADRSEFTEFEISAECRVGFLAQVVTPGPDYYGAKLEGGKPVHGAYTWGYTNSKWFYGLTLEDIVTQAVKWKDKLCEEAWNTPTNQKGSGLL